MPFDPTTAKPVAQAQAGGGFDPTTARPVTAGPQDSSAIPGESPAFLADNARRNAAARAAGVTTAADAVANEPDPSKDNGWAKLNGALIETPLSLGTGMLGQIAGNLYGVGHEIVTGHLGDGTHDAERTAAGVAQAMTYQPRTNTARYLLGKAADVAQNIPPVIPELGALQAGASSTTSALRQLAGPSALAADAADVATVANGARGSLRELIAKPAPAMAGVGAANTGEAAMRLQRAASMDPPLPLTKGMATRDPVQVRFESDTARQPGGEALNQRNVDLNQKVFQNIDNLGDETGAQAPTLRETGKVVTKAVVDKFNAKQAEVQKAYQDARESGAMEEPVSYAPLANYLTQHEAEATTGNASMLSAVKRKLELLDPDNTGKISINDAEELRKMASRLTVDGTPNAAYVGPVKRLIDASTEDAGGDLYRQARRLNENFKNEFENVGTIDKMMRTKPGTNDRAVAYEDVASHILTDGSLDDVRHVFRTLTAYPKGADPALVAQGQQAAQELRGALIGQIKKAATGTARDSSGNPVGQFGAVDKLVNSLDADGKLDYIFGKVGAQKVRDVRDAMGDVYSKPPGTVNASNNSAEIVAAMDQLGKVVGTLRAIPGVSTAAKYAEGKIKARQLNKKVDAALNPDGTP